MFFPQLTLARHLGMVLSLYGLDPGTSSDVALEHLKNLDLLPLIDKRLFAFSRGQLYKAALACLLTIDPELWLLDEPFASGMDPNGIAYIKRQMAEAAKRGRTIFYSTQILDIAEKVSNRVFVIEKGRLQRFESLASLQASASAGGNVLEDLFQKFRERP